MQHIDYSTDKDSQVSTTDDTPSNSGGWQGMYRWLECEPSYSVTAGGQEDDDGLDDLLSPRERILLDVGIDPSERHRAEVIAR